MTRRAKKQMGRKFDKLIFVISEGEVTEPSYLKVLEKQRENGRIEVVMKGNKNTRKITAKVEEVKRKNGESSEIWIVVDMNSRSESQLQDLCQLQKGNVKIALSNPCFELWILLHYENAIAVRGSANNRAAKALCLQILKGKKGWKEFQKFINPELIGKQDILNAVKRAKRYDNSKRKPWPDEVGSTTFYKLVESYLG